MTQLIRSLKIVDKAFLKEKDKQTKCHKCGKRPATGQDCLCDHCRFGELLTGMVVRK